MSTAWASVASKEHGHGHEHVDHNLRAAYLHVLADALTSVLAIVALGGGLLFGWAFLDPAMGIVGALVVGRWAFGLARDSAGVLLDAEDHGTVAAEIRRIVTAEPDHELATCTSGASARPAAPASCRWSPTPRSRSNTTGANSPASPGWITSPSRSTTAATAVQADAARQRRLYARRTDIRFAWAAKYRLHKLRNLWHSSEPGGMPCKCNTSATASGGFTG